LGGTVTDNRIRVERASDPARFLATDQTVWFSEVPAAPVEEQLLGLPEDQRFAADVEGSDSASYPGVYAVYPMTLSVPGPDAGVRQVPCAGLTWVGVHPDHRRRGVLTAMMRHHLEQVHEQPGSHVSVLHASEPAIYGRYGYGLASLELEVSLGRGTTFTAPHLDDAAAATTTRMGSVTDADAPERMRECHLATAEVGAVIGELAYYRRVCQQLPEWLRDKESWRVLYARRDGVDVGFAMFRRSHKWDRGRPSGEVSVWGLVGDPAARLTLLRRLVDLDLVGTVKLRAAGVDDPLLLWAGGPRSTSDVGTYDSLWVRLVDLREALEERTWIAPCDVVVEVADTTAPWNDGTWHIRSDGTRATVERSTARADLALPVGALGAAYLGGGNLVGMYRAGLVTETRPGAVAELWRAMRTDLLPTAAFMF
jgi:GNAT superfamily N-acetyltransferase